MKEENEYDNMSLDGKVAFRQDDHQYINLEDPSTSYTSVTTLIKQYKEPFDSEVVAKRVVADPSSIYFGKDWEEVVNAWNLKATTASNEGTILHAYGEDLLNGLTPTPPDLPKAKWVPILVDDLFSKGYELAKTELLLYSNEFNVAGQSDILLKRDGDFMIYDFKFLSKPISKKSYYNSKTKSYKRLEPPFQYLNDCNWIHYSIQLALYQTLLGKPERIKEKVLVVVLDDGFTYVPAYPMRVYFNNFGELHVVHETWNGKWYASESNRFYKQKPKWIKGI